MNVALERISWPEFDVPTDRPVISRDELIGRCDQLYARAGVDWVCVYGDKEHFANLLFLIDFDPRFEEILLVLGPDGKRVLIAGSEGMLYGTALGVVAEMVHYQPFSLMGQPLSSPTLPEILQEIGIVSGQHVGVAGWKWQECRPSRPSYVPALIVDEIRTVTGIDPVDVTPHLLDPVDGLRATATADQIAQFEWGASRSSRGIMPIVRGARPGMTELELAALMPYAGEPLTTHLILASSDGPLNGLRSAVNRKTNDGDAVVAGVGFWGGLCARAGLLTSQPRDDFFRTVVRPYFAAIATWWSTVGIGVTAGELFEASMTPLRETSFGSLLNPGHLTGHDEWLHGFVREGDTSTVRSGMTFQADIIPYPLPAGLALNCEDTLAIAGPELRDEIRQRHPQVWTRIEERRGFMASLGIDLRPEVLPLSFLPGLLPPYWGDHELVCTVA